jgi:serine protease Do
MIRQLNNRAIRSGTSFIQLAAVIIALLSLKGSAFAQSSLLQREAARIETIERITPSVVCVMAASGEGGGSGVLISPDGFAISNYHVTSGSGTFMKCGLSDGKLYDAVIVGIDPTGDVALLKMIGRTDFLAAQPGNSDAVKVGDEVMALGNPFLLASDFTPTVTYGIVSGVRRYQYPANTFLEYTDCIQIDASINPGNSGGPLFDINGYWIGINGRASFEKRGRVNSGAAYAISVNQVLKFVDHLKCGLIVDHGVTEFTVETNTDGEVVVKQISELSEAWRRGLRPQDQILSFAGRIVTSANDLQNILGTFPEGTRVPFRWRNREGVHENTIRLRPLHAFQSAPELPEERRPQPNDPEKTPDEMPKDADHTLTEAEDLPKELKQLYVEKEGFCNYYYNDLQQQRLLKPLRDALSKSPDRQEKWQAPLSLQLGEKKIAGELIFSPSAIGLKLGDTPYLQDAADPKPEEEPVELPGFLTAMIQLQKLLTGKDSAFSEQLAMGSTLHLPLQKTVNILVTKESTRTSRWYFEFGVVFPVGLDVESAPGVDETRLLFENWSEKNGIHFPTRIGIVTGSTEEVVWLTINAA